VIRGVRDQHSLSIPLAEAVLDIDAPVSTLMSTTDPLLDPKFFSILILNDDRFEGGASSSPLFDTEFFFPMLSFETTESRRD